MEHVPAGRDEVKPSGDDAGFALMQALSGLRWDDDLDRKQREEVHRLLKQPAIEVPSQLLDEARRRVVKRVNSVWTGLNTQPVHRRKYIAVGGPPGAELPLLEAEGVELLIMQLLAFTSPARQYAVSAVGAVFASWTNGHSRESERLYVSGLSPLIDEVGQFVFDFRAEVDRGIGGRFYERGGLILDAVSKKPLLRVRAAG